MTREEAIKWMEEAHTRHQYTLGFMFGCASKGA